MLRGPIRFTNALAGTANFIYPGPTIDMQSPASAGATDGELYIYYAQSLDMTEWEIGSGAYTQSSGTFARTTVWANSAGTTAKINFTNKPQVLVMAGAATESALSVGAPAQCKLYYTDASHVTLKPFNGNQIKINGALYSIPAAGVSYAASGLIASTLYYFYAYLNAGVLTIEASTAAHAQSTTAGNVGTEIKSGDDTRSLVGCAFSNGSSQFTNTAASRLVRSWFNDNGIVTFASSGTLVSTFSTTAVELDASCRTSALLWANEQFEAKGSAQAFSSVANQIAYVNIAINGAISGIIGFAYSVNANTQAQAVPMTSTAASVDGVYTSQLFHASSSGAASASYAAKSTQIISLR